MKKIKLFDVIHKSTKRDYLSRMSKKKPAFMKLAKEYGYHYWDGSRETGYGGYKYIKNYWSKFVIKLIKKYRLDNNSHILDIGCGKGFLLYELKNVLPKINLTGIDISTYAIKKAPKTIKPYLKFGDARKKLKFGNKKFDLALSMGCIHNLEIDKISLHLKEISRVSKNQYILTESYRNNIEMFNLQCWALTCETFFSVREWEWFLKKNKYKGDYELIFFE
tara:strand:- start:356 stop:1018 length:663 start_codon:yes stop_codon:yes gene_type:complete